MVFIKGEQLEGGGGACGEGRFEVGEHELEGGQGGGGDPLESVCELDICVSG